MFAISWAATPVFVVVNWPPPGGRELNGTTTGPFEPAACWWMCAAVMLLLGPLAFHEPLIVPAAGLSVSVTGPLAPAVGGGAAPGASSSGGRAGGPAGTAG